MKPRELGPLLRQRCRCQPVLFLVATGLLFGCRSRQIPSQPPSASGHALDVNAPSASGHALDVNAPSATEQVLLSGAFERVARAVTGTAKIIRRGSDYELRLEAVTVRQEGVVRVYLVGQERADTTRKVDETELKYDMAELERGAAEQRIALPSAPDEALKSVVLYYPAFGVNLAVAPLRPPTTAR